MNAPQEPPEPKEIGTAGSDSAHREDSRDSAPRTVAERAADLDSVQAAQAREASANSDPAHGAGAPRPGGHPDPADAADAAGAADAAAREELSPKPARARRITHPKPSRAVAPRPLVSHPDGRASGTSQPFASEGPPRRKRAEKSQARREAILAAALDAFTERGFALTRMEDVARRAGVGKGTIYLHFKDKEALFQQLVTTMLGPIVAQLRKLPDEDEPVRFVLERLFTVFAKDIYGTKRREVLRLVMTEGPRFPPLAEFYYRQVVEPAIAMVRGLLDRACARGELRQDRLAEFPQLVVAPALVAVIWSGLFERFAPLDMAGLMRAHLDLLFGPGGEP